MFVFKANLFGHPGRRNIHSGAQANENKFQWGRTPIFAPAAGFLVGNDNRQVTHLHPAGGVINHNTLSPVGNQFRVGLILLIGHLFSFLSWLDQTVSQPIDCGGSNLVDNVLARVISFRIDQQLSGAGGSSLQAMGLFQRKQGILSAVNDQQGTANMACHAIER
jgi:hypothetical protein